MHHLKKSVTAPCSAARMFELVADVERYREFLPWCTGSRILEQKDGEVVAEIHVGHGSASTSFATRNRNQPYKLVEMQLVDGPFKALEGSWHFEALPDGGCRATLELEFDFAGHILGTLFDLVFKEAMENLVSAFRKQCVRSTLPSASFPE